MMKLKRIDRTLFNAGTLSVKLLILLNLADSKYASFKKDLAMNGNIEEYGLSTSMLPLLIFDIYEKDTIYDRSKQLVIQPRYLPQLLIGLHKVIDQFDRDDIFYIKGRSTSMYAFKEDMAVTINNIGENHLLATPAIIEDNLNDGAMYEGYQFYFNKTTHHTALTYDEIVSLYHLLNRMDIYSLSQSLLVTLILSTMNEHLDLKEPTKVRTVVPRDGHIDPPTSSNKPSPFGL